MSLDVTTAWYWEGNVVGAIAKFLELDGWTIISMADTHTKAQGIDLHATKNGSVLLIEAKGYPSKQYRDPLRAAETKSTHPTNQAQHWYSHALLKVVRLQTKYPDAIIALAFPDFPRYRTLFEETRIGLAKLGIALLMVDESGEVDTWGM
jgi:Holliday junction resolvase-like predicted endonuclease